MKVASPYPVLFILLITTSPFYLWEVLVRSNIFLNAILIACSIVLFFRIKNYASLKNQLFIGGIIGLLLSTRNVFALCYIIFFLHTIRTGQLSLQSAIKIGGISILVFISTFCVSCPQYIGLYLSDSRIIYRCVLLYPVYSVLFILPSEWTIGSTKHLYGKLLH